MRTHRQFAVLLVTVLQLDLFLLQVFAQEASPTRRRRSTSGAVAPQLSDAEKLKQAKEDHYAGWMAYESGDYEEGIRKLKAACQADPQARYYNLWAWCLATCPHKNLRSFLSVSIADTACEKTEYKDPIYLDTYAAAFAQMTDYDSAIKWEKKAIELAGDSRKIPKSQISSMKLRLELYEEKIPYREVPTAAIFAHYKEIVGKKLSAASLDNVTEDEESQLADFLLKIPELRYMGAEPKTIKQHWDIFLLILTSESMDYDERSQWADRLPNLSSAKLEKLRDILIDEREGLDAADEEYQKSLSSK